MPSIPLIAYSQQMSSMRAPMAVCLMNGRSREKIVTCPATGSSGSIAPALSTKIPVMTDLPQPSTAIPTKSSGSSMPCLFESGKRPLSYLITRNLIMRTYFMPLYQGSTMVMFSSLTVYSILSMVLFEATKKALYVPALLYA